MYEGVVQNLIDELGRLPGVGPKGAQRIAFHLLAADHAEVRRLADALIEVTEQVRFCRTCGNVAEADECRICLDPRRDPSVICVVEEPKDVAAIEKIREFRGRYHVLGGAISPIDGIGPEDLRIRELMARLADGNGHRADPRHRPQPRRRGDRHLSGPAGQADGPAGDQARERTAGRGGPGVRRRGHAGPRVRRTETARCLNHRHERQTGPARTGARWRTRSRENARDFIDGVAALARGEGGDETVPLLLLEVSQILLAGAQLGASRT